MTEPNFETLWGAIPYPAFAIDTDNTLLTCNGAAEFFSGTSVRQMSGKNLLTFVGEGSVVQNVVEQARRDAVSVVLHGIEVSWADNPPRQNDVHATSISNGQVLLLLHPRGLAEKMDRSLTHRSAARSVAGMAAMLAHEIRNPLAGINGAAQLLAMSVNEDDQELTELIQDEIRRIGRLVDRVEQFGDLRPAQRVAVNIHDILNRAKRAAEVGFAEHVKFSEEFDPSLPPVSADPDQLSQVFQNLLKNAAEATPKVGGSITVKTAFRPGVRLQMPGQQPESLPLEVTVTDNGVGIPEELINDIFDPFVSSKATGSGLGLSLVSKIIADHGGVIECNSEPGKTKFKVLLPIWRKPLTES
ncbi:MAG: ATP-binding protein [Paracoccaceae bacterium]|jgi:two-component system nitrogen regulation sensor histidine kinase GlnL